VKIGMLYDSDYPWDVRLWKSATSLVEHGHEVHLVCRNLARRAEEQTLERIRIHRLSPLRNAQLNAFATFPVFVNPLWLGRVAQVVRTHRIEVLVIRDLPLALAGVAVGRRYSVPVILDMAENYPALLRDAWRFERFRLQNVLVRNPAFATLVERIAIRLVDLTLVVIEEARDRLIRLGVPAERISIVRNTPKVELTRFPAAWGEPERDTTRLNLVFVGGLEPMRGLEAVLELLSVALPLVPELHLTIIGDGRWKGDLQARARAVGVDAHVVFAGRREYQRALFEVQRADIGLIPHRITAHTNSTIPNKLFEYMLLGKPVLATDMAPVRRILLEVGCGLVYRTSDEAVEALRRLRDKVLRHSLGEKGRRAVLERYRWDLDGGVFVRAVEGLVAACPVTLEPPP
jgi:glycosyltransferase involved in cell wall biosynthesis